MVKRIISCLLFFAILFTCSFSLVSYADKWDAYEYSAISLYDWLYSGDFSYIAGWNFWPEFFRQYYDIEESSDYESAYADYVDTLPLNGYGSDGSLYWQPTFANYSSISFYPASFGSEDVNFSSLSGTSATFTYTGVSYGSITTSFVGVAGRTSYMPVSGSYYLVSSPALDIYFNGVYVSSVSYPLKSNSCSVVGDGIAPDQWYIKSSSNVGIPFGTGYSYIYHTPVFRVVPTTSVSSSTYSEDTRLGGITFDLGVESTGSGDVTVYNDITVIDEQNNTFTDPSTGMTYPIDSWQYDYGQRKYNLVIPTVDGTLNAIVEFGVDSLNINFGGQTIEYSYMVETHSHEYVGAITTQPTCTQPGTKTYSCIICNDSYTEPVQALGHDYQLSEVEPFYYELDSSSVLCPECDSDDVTCSQSGDTSTFNCSCNDCSHAWTVTGSAVAGRNKFVCSRCGDITYDDVGTDEDMSDIPFWKWLQQWLIRFKEWLGEKLDGLSPGSDSPGSGNTYDVDFNDNDITFNYTTEGDDGDEEDATFKLSDLFKKFGFVKDIYQIGRSLITQVTNDASYAASYDSNFAFLDAGGEEAASSGTVPAQTDGAGIMVDGVPSLTLNLGAAQSNFGWSYGGTVIFLDLSWYTPYKSTVDNIVSGFMWLAFCWALFKKAPGIISGASLDSEKVDDIKSGKRGS